MRRKFKILSGAFPTNADATEQDLPVAINCGHTQLFLSDNPLRFDSEDRTLFLIGVAEFFVDGNKNTLKQKPREILKLFLRCHSDEQLTRLASFIEGRFVLVEIARNGSLRVLTDRFGKCEVFFRQEDAGLALVSDLSLLPDSPAKRGYDSLGIAHTLTYYGYRPPKRHTIYSQVRRIGIGDVLSFKNAKVLLSKRTAVPERVSAITEFDSKGYRSAFLGFLESVGDPGKNVVYLSSGWDSTAILAGLVEVFGSDSVAAVTGRMLYSKRSGVCNQFEVDRAQKFAQHFGIDLAVVDLNYRDQGEEQFANVADLALDRHFHSFTGVNHFLLARKVLDEYGNVPVFAGEISDGAHNLGFSQYATLFHPSYGFREYADKMAGYLFGPTFLKRVLDDSFESDYVFQFFKGVRGPDVVLDPVAKSSSDRKLQFLTSFFLRNGRFPFWSASNIKLLTPKGQAQYSQEMADEYLTPQLDFDPDDLYSVILELYNSFHWQGSTVATLQATAEDVGLKAYLPFWDLRLQELLAIMPERMGRGLDLNPTKFPLKQMLEKELNYPLELQKGPHAYTYDVDHSFNHNEELLRFSSLTENARAILSSGQYESILDPELFDFDYIRNSVKKLTSDQELSAGEREDCVSIFLMLKTGVFS